MIGPRAGTRVWLAAGVTDMAACVDTMEEVLALLHRGDYRMVYNPQAGHVALYRQHTIDPADQLPPEPGLGTRELLSRPAGSAGGPAVGQAGLGRGAAASAFARESTHKTTTDRGASGRDGSWFAHRGVAAVKRDRGLGL